MKQEATEVPHARHGLSPRPSGRGARQLLADTEHVEIVDLEKSSALRIGLLAGRSGHCDVVDLHVAVCARDRGHAVVTSDRQDIAKIDSKLQVIDV